MRASDIVIMVDILKEDALQMSGIQDKDQIQALFSDSSNPLFDPSFCIRFPVGGVDDMKGFNLKDGVKGIGKLAVIGVNVEE